MVAPLVGAWIEIDLKEFVRPIYKSLPSWERGLKYQDLAPLIFRNRVAPLVGAWIEIYEIAKQLEIYVVAPLVGAWIEIL